jgi:hypothetical protein
MKKLSSEGKGIKPFGIWKVYPDKNTDAIQPRWWHKLMFWKKWNYGEWKIRTEYKKLSDIMDNMAGKKL